MTKNEYRELMMDIIAMAIRECEAEPEDAEHEEYIMGVIHGLRVAYHKLKYSAFLTEEENRDE